MAERLKNRFFSADSLVEMANSLSEHFDEFDRNQFLESVQDSNWDGLELTEKMRHTTTCLRRCLPKDYKKALKILVQSAPSIGGFEAMVLPDFVQVYGLDDWEESMAALAHFTRFSSSEFAVRKFLEADPERALQTMREWAEDENEHVRRLASEGCRPRLPWAPALQQFKKDPRPLLPILELLKEDESEYVRRSVANNLNDISKDHPDLILELCEGWYGNSEITDWIVKRACRTLLKAGNRRALKIFGYGDPEILMLEEFTVKPESVRIGQTVDMSVSLRVPEPERLKVRIEYRVNFATAGGRRSVKTFQVVDKSFDPGLQVMKRKYSFRDRSTRKHYPGTHLFTIVVNGVNKSSVEVELRPESGR